MDITAAKAAKEALENRIALALREFTEDTGLVVSAIEIDATLSFGGAVPTCYQVSSEVPL